MHDATGAHLNLYGRRWWGWIEDHSLSTITVASSDICACWCAANSRLAFYLVCSIVWLRFLMMRATCDACINGRATDRQTVLLFCIQRVEVHCCRWLMADVVVDDRPDAPWAHTFSAKAVVWRCRARTPQCLCFLFHCITIAKILTNKSWAGCGSGTEPYVYAQINAVRWLSNGRCICAHQLWSVIRSSLSHHHPYDYIAPSITPPPPSRRPFL